MRTVFDENYWNERYGQHGNIWSGNPNPQLLTETTNLPPGTALDVGCGEGADTVWLAGLGWQVTGVDISTVALDRAAAHASGLELPGSIAWEHHNLLEWAPRSAAFDLVSAQFMHLPKTDRDPLFARLADAVAPGGTLLLVGHSPHDVEAGVHRDFGADLFYTAQQLAEVLDASSWEIAVAEARPRTSAGHDGQTITIHDEVLRAVRRA
ncbi:bifunctional 2-polyprenyl-6-hydroxyphenol methylase/3-demethylubiquinol 3-O-methyltransferase UbiG [Arthrobacter sp. GMC3]|uniref:class I SAM-dependent methyltransferase n=1 Tax=Arthrobacter sp. GMC3 TaxID=2058894 RepID=UPI000CE57C75|nr:class I SAM-dependent methyltransferase [Arthrobacter sp. GMC3]